MLLHDLPFGLLAVALGLALFAGMLVLLELGWRLGLGRVSKYGKDGLIGVGTVDTPVYGLLALLVGFTFSGAAGRFDYRRELVAREANAIGTAWIRIDALPPPLQPAIRAGLRDYVDALIAAYEIAPSFGTEPAEPAPIARARRRLWADAMAACLTADGDKARMLLLPSLNEMFDLADADRLAGWIHPPLLIYVMLGVAALATGLFAGIALARAPTRNWVYMVGIAATVAIALYVTIELEFPRRGLFHIDTMNRALVDVRAEMK